LTGGLVYITAAGIVSPLGCGLADTEKALRANISAISPLHIFPLLQNDPLPAGQVSGLDPSQLLPPRTHLLAREAARQAMQGCPEPPEAVVLGCTTGGILTTEHLLRQGDTDRAAYRYHGLASVAEDIAEICGCSGPAIAISTACSSSAVAITLALNLLRSGRMRRVLAGGVDSLSRLTYFGFHSLQLVDRRGCRPLDISRQGLAVAEASGMLLLTTERPAAPLAILLGAGLSCDAHHATAPHPEGRGAIAAMQAALTDAGITPTEVDYINLHGTGTPDNDLAEARAITTVFAAPPPLSSIKGATGHSLAAAGGLEAVVSCLAVSRGILPGNTGCKDPDPVLGVKPLAAPSERPVRTVLSNSFGFGGNNGCLLFGRADFPARAGNAPESRRPLAIHGISCLTGAGLTQATLARLGGGQHVSGRVSEEDFNQYLPPRLTRRLKRLARLALLLATTAHKDTGEPTSPRSIFMGTGWGALSETHDFLDRLYTSTEQFPSPTDFVGSVHNGAAGQIAMLFNANGANVTTSGGDASFEHALLAADQLLAPEGESALLLGADEGHERLSPLLDSSVATDKLLADGGGALFINRDPRGARSFVQLSFHGLAEHGTVDRLVAALGGRDRLAGNYAAVLVGIPAGKMSDGERQLDHFRRLTGNCLPICRYRRFTGEFASASAVAAVLAVAFLTASCLPGVLVAGPDVAVEQGQRILVLGTGRYLSAMEFWRP
jgi:3-oxoacyl-(acyl-carrier-protein) synthase